MIQLHTRHNRLTAHCAGLQAGCPSCRPTNSVKALKHGRFASNWFPVDMPLAADVCCDKKLCYRRGTARHAVSVETVGWLWVTQGHRQCHHSIERTYDFLFDFNRNRASILYRFREIASYLSKVADFSPPHLHLSPPQWLTLVEFRRCLWHKKTRVSGLSCGVVCVIPCLAVLVEHRLVTFLFHHKSRPSASPSEPRDWVPQDTYQGNFLLTEPRQAVIFLRCPGVDNLAPWKNISAEKKSTDRAKGIKESGAE